MTKADRSNLCRAYFNLHNFLNFRVLDYMGNKLPDAMIAATALQNGFILVTNNTKDFKNIEGLEVIDPYQL